MTGMVEFCGALNASGTRCRNAPVAETGGWRCLKHLDWYETATKEERERLAIIEIEETLATLGSVQQEDLDTHRPGLPRLFG